MNAQCLPGHAPRQHHRPLVSHQRPPCLSTAYHQPVSSFSTRLHSHDTATTSYSFSPPSQPLSHTSHFPRNSISARQPHVAMPSRMVSCLARRRRDNYDDDGDEEEQGYGYKRSKGRVDINLNGNRISLAEGNLALLGVLTLGLAAVLGPLVIGVVVAAVAVGAAVSLGAFALSFFWVPFVALFGFIAFSFLLPFGAFATLGLGLIFPKALSMVIAGGGIALGWFVVNNLLPSRTSATAQKSTTFSSGSDNRTSFSGGRPGVDDGPVVKAESRSLSSEEEAAAEAEVRRMARELREFDSMMAEKEEQRRVDEWRKKTRGL